MENQVFTLTPESIIAAQAVKDYADNVLRDSLLSIIKHHKGDTQGVRDPIAVRMSEICKDQAIIYNKDTEFVYCSLNVLGIQDFLQVNRELEDFVNKTIYRICLIDNRDKFNPGAKVVTVKVNQEEFKVEFIYRSPKADNNIFTMPTQPANS